MQFFSLASQFCVHSLPSHACTQAAKIKNHIIFINWFMRKYNKTIVDSRLYPSVQPTRSTWIFITKQTMVEINAGDSAVTLSKCTGNSHAATETSRSTTKIYQNTTFVIGEDRVPICPWTAISYYCSKVS